MIYSKPEILTAIDNSFSAMMKFIEAQDELNFIAAPSGKWTSGQHLYHLVKTTRPVSLALLLPLFSLKLFGKPNRTERTYDELVLKYKKKLASGAKAPAIFIPPNINFKQRSKQ